MFVDGGKLFDDDLCDEELMLNGTILLCKKSAKFPESPKHVPCVKTEPLTPKLSRSYTDDTVSVDSESSRPSTPLSHDGDTEKEVRLPKFSILLHRGLTEAGYKPCSNDLWKKVNITLAPYI